MGVGLGGFMAAGLVNSVADRGRRSSRVVFDKFKDEAGCE